MPTGPGSFIETRLGDWRGLLLPTARFRPDGTVAFGDKSKPQNFEALRTDVIQIWPPPARSRKIAPKTDLIQQAIHQFYPNRIPEPLSARERNVKIRNHLESQGVKFQSNEAFERAIQRVLREHRRKHD
jgi:hypothetical protein